MTVLLAFIAKRLKPRYALGVQVVAVDRATQQILLLNPVYTSEWRLPGGLVNRKERAAAAAVRELREEAGIVGQSLEQIGVIQNPASGWITWYYCCLLPAPVSRQVTPIRPEIRALKWVKWEMMPEYAAKGLRELGVESINQIV